VGHYRYPTEAPYINLNAHSAHLHYRKSGRVNHYEKLGWTAETLIELYEEEKIDEKKVVEILQKSLYLFQNKAVSN
jgi:DNA-directed RNA polymerase alpha subunit